jgi:hypothetical protein
MRYGQSRVLWFGSIVLLAALLFPPMENKSEYFGNRGENFRQEVSHEGLKFIADDVNGSVSHLTWITELLVVGGWTVLLFFLLSKGGPVEPDRSKTSSRNTGEPGAKVGHPIGQGGRGSPAEAEPR